MVSVVLRNIEGRARGAILLPMRQTADALTIHSAAEGGALSAAEALGLATTHALDFRTDVAVVDADGVWRPEWGTLHDGPPQMEPDAVPPLAADGASVQDESAVDPVVTAVGPDGKT